MRIHSIRHQDLKRFVENDDSRSFGTDLVDRLRNVLTALIVARDMQ